jgi:hypothetical protein
MAASRQGSNFFIDAVFQDVPELHYAPREQTEYDHHQQADVQPPKRDLEVLFQAILSKTTTSGSVEKTNLLIY